MLTSKWHQKEKTGYRRQKNNILLTDRQTDGRTTDERVSDKLDWSLTSRAKRDITHGNLILQKPFLHFRTRLKCNVEENCLSHVVDHT